MSYANQEKQAVDHPPNDGSEQIPAEVQANPRKEVSQSLNEPLGAGYTVNEEGVLNNYATEPKMSLAKYPSPQQKWRYVLLGAAAILFVALAVWIAFRVS